MKIVGLITTTLLLILAATLLNGFTLAQLWAWFMVPTFGLPKLSIPAALGLAQVITFFTYRASDDKKADEDDSAMVKFCAQFAHLAIKCGVFLLIGWIITWFL